MKIVYWNSNAFGGARIYMKELAKGVKAMCVHAEIEEIFLPIGIKSIFLPLVYRIRDADIIHATTQTVSIFSLFRNLGTTKLVVTVHDLNHIYYFSLSAEYILKKLFVSKSLRRADKLITVSNFYKDEIVRLLNIPQEKVSVTYLGIDHSKFKPLDKDKCRERLGLDKAKKYILAVASISQRKRMDLTKKAFKRITEMRKDVYLLKVGSGKLEEKGVINFGKVSNEKMPFFYNASDVLLHTSEYESFGMPLLEAMACGLPIVASNKASIPEVVGDCGELVDLNDDCVEVFAEKVLECINKDERNLKGIERSKKFSWEETARETMKVYEELL